MIYCILSKTVASLIAVAIINWRLINSNLFSAFLIGILPIWAEVLASYLTKAEPARSKMKAFLISDAVIDAMVFLIVPTFWYWLQLESKDTITSISLVIFIVCGVGRLVRFLKNGLTQDGFFTGLPVTYTGYIWLILVAMGNTQLQYLAPYILLIASWAMVSKKIKIKASR